MSRSSSSTKQQHSPFIIRKQPLTTYTTVTAFFFLLFTSLTQGESLSIIKGPLLTVASTTLARKYRITGDSTTTTATTTQASSSLLSTTPKEEMGRQSTNYGSPMATRDNFPTFGKSAPETSSKKYHDSNSCGNNNNNDVVSQLDRLILKTALPAMLNLAIVPVVTSIETMWIGRMPSALPLAGQSAASTAYLTIFYLLGFLPTMVAPTVAKLTGAGQKNQQHEDARRRIIGEMMTLSIGMGLVGTMVFYKNPFMVLKWTLPAVAGEASSPVVGPALQYLTIKAWCLIPMLINATSFAAFRGVLDTTTPLMVTLVSAVLKLALDPILIFYCHHGLIGAPLASLVSESVGCVINTSLLVRRRLLDLSNLSHLLPRWKATIAPLLSGGVVMILRQMAINIATLKSSQSAQGGPGGGAVTAAAYGITMSIYTIGFVVHVAMQGAAASLIPSEWARRGYDAHHARMVTDRLFRWSCVMGVLLGALQWTVLPFILPLFTTLPEVREAVKAPALVASVLHVVNGPRFVSEGMMIGLQSFKGLTGITVVGVSLLVACLRGGGGGWGSSLQGVMMANLVFCSFQTVVLYLHYRFVGKLKQKGVDKIKD